MSMGYHSHSLCYLVDGVQIAQSRSDTLVLPQSHPILNALNPFREFNANVRTLSISTGPYQHLLSEISLQILDNICIIKEKVFQWTYEEMYNSCHLICLGPLWKWLLDTPDKSSPLFHCVLCMTFISHLLHQSCVLQWIHNIKHWWCPMSTLDHINPSHVDFTDNQYKIELLMKSHCTSIV